VSLSRRSAGQGLSRAGGRRSFRASDAFQIIVPTMKETGTATCRWVLTSLRTVIHCGTSQAYRKFRPSKRHHRPHILVSLESRIMSSNLQKLRRLRLRMVRTTATAARRVDGSLKSPAPGSRPPTELGKRTRLFALGATRCRFNGATVDRPEDKPDRGNRRRF
jgi:hypothetical protein